MKPLAVLLAAAFEQGHKTKKPVHAKMNELIQIRNVE